MKKSVYCALMIAVAVTPFLLSGCGVTAPTQVAAETENAEYAKIAIPTAIAAATFAAQIRARYPHLMRR